MTEHQVSTAEAFAHEKLRRKSLVLTLNPLDVADLTASVQRAEPSPLMLEPPDCDTDVGALHALAHQLTSDEHDLAWLQTYMRLVQRWCDYETEGVLRQEYLRQGVRFS